MINFGFTKNRFPKASKRILLLFSRRISPVDSEISLVVVEVGHAGLASKRSLATDGNEDFLLEKSLFVVLQYSTQQIQPLQTPGLILVSAIGVDDDIFNVFASFRHYLSSDSRGVRSAAISWPLLQAVAPATDNR